jgi:hypothetical protein
MTYFSQLYRYNKCLCFLISSFCTLTVIVNILEIETTPLFVWSMYSKKEKSLDGYDIFKVIANDSIAIDYSSTFTDANRFFLLSPLTHYSEIYQNSGRDPLEDFLKRKTGKYFGILNQFGGSIYNDSCRQMAFKKWYVDYLEGTIHLKITKLELNILHLNYDPNGHPEFRSKIKIAL